MWHVSSQWLFECSEERKKRCLEGSSSSVFTLADSAKSSRNSYMNHASR